MGCQAGVAERPGRDAVTLRAPRSPWARMIEGAMLGIRPITRETLSGRW